MAIGMPILADLMANLWRGSGGVAGGWVSVGCVWPVWRGDGYCRKGRTAGAEIFDLLPPNRAFRLTSLSQLSDDDFVSQSTRQ